MTTYCHKEGAPSMRYSVQAGRQPGGRRSLRAGTRIGDAAVSLLLAATFLVAALAAPAAAAERGQQLQFGVEMARRGLWSEALFRFRRADLEDPGNPRILNNLAVAHEAVGQFDEAMELYQRAVKLDPANAELKRNYARFVEFYQGFRPRDEEPASEASAESGEEPGGDGADENSVEGE